MLFVSLFVASVLALSQAAILTPVEDIVTHSNPGDYIDQVQGKEFICKPEIAFVVDTSPSIGRNHADGFLVSLLANIESQLARLPSEPGDNTQGSNLHLITFNKLAKGGPLNSIGATQLSIKRRIQQSIKSAPIEGGTCISCGIEKAVLTLLDNAESAESKKYIVVISDGFNNDRSGNNPNSPEEQASLARAAGINVLTLGVSGKKGATDTGLLMSLADNSSRFWKVTTGSESNSGAVDLVDLIAGESCLGFR